MNILATFAILQMILIHFWALPHLVITLIMLTWFIHGYSTNSKAVIRFLTLLVLIVIWVFRRMHFTWLIWLQLLKSLLGIHWIIWLFQNWFLMQIVLTILDFILKGIICLIDEFKFLHPFLSLKFLKSFLLFQK